MINQKSITAVDNSKFGEHFIKPLYNSYCFSRIPQTVINLLTNEDGGSFPVDVFSDKKSFNKVVFLFVDGFGWRFFEKYQDKYPSLQRFIKQGIVSKITSQFPSTTPVHVTTINTGLDVATHGVYEWFYFEPTLDAVIAPLLFSFAKDYDRDTLKQVDVDPKTLYPTTTIYQQLNQLKIKSYVFPSASFADSPYNKVMNNGVTKSIPYQTLPELFDNLTELLLSEKEKAYFYFYYGQIDSMGHIHGPESIQFETEINNYFTGLEELFFKKIEGKLENTIPDIADYLLKTKQGEPIVPAGSCRDFFLHVKPDKIDHLESILIGQLKGIAEVYKIEQLINQGFFGSSKPSDNFLSRVGNFVILPYVNQAVWWYQSGVFEQRNRGHHGGLTKKEIEIPFLTLEY